MIYKSWVYRITMKWRNIVVMVLLVTFYQWSALTCRGATAKTWAYGTEVMYHLEEPLQFPDFTMTYIGERVVPVDVAPGKFLYHDFEVVKKGEKKLVSWTPGTGALGVDDFEFQGKTYFFQHGTIFTLGFPSVYTIKIGPSDEFTCGIGGMVRRSESLPSLQQRNIPALTPQEIEEMRRDRAKGAERRVTGGNELYQIKKPDALISFWVPLAWEGHRFDVSHTYPREMWHLSYDQLVNRHIRLGFKDFMDVTVEVAQGAPGIPQKSLRKNHLLFFSTRGEGNTFNETSVCVAGSSVAGVFKTSPVPFGENCVYHSFAADLYIDNTTVLAEGVVTRKEDLDLALGVVCDMELSGMKGR